MVGRRVRKGIDWMIGIALIAFGVLGGLIPILPGWVFVVAGLAVLSSHSRRARFLHLRLQSLGQKVGLRWKVIRRADTGKDDDGPLR